MRLARYFPGQIPKRISKRSSPNHGDLFITLGRPTKNISYITTVQEIKKNTIGVALDYEQIPCVPLFVLVTTSLWYSSTKLTTIMSMKLDKHVHSSNIYIFIKATCHLLFVFKFQNHIRSVNFADGFHDLPLSLCCRNYSRNTYAFFPRQMPVREICCVILLYHNLSFVFDGYGRILDHQCSWRLLRTF